ncbi:hypothetical protein HQ865_03060 [Mucilaginibacter mali]|uniref:Uncharacterized protein n=1 Tax=Mucilaginibacter mali TaxID=2740462 RepID=A0A7D4UC05_9SPHI|nr:hypothetical protein [Mucilaginibacter mali]QKJ28779.1 hypothetical protein HQ865_03060 [Mucilaginibacter mali]
MAHRIQDGEPDLAQASIKKLVESTDNNHYKWWRKCVSTLKKHGSGEKTKN